MRLICLRFLVITCVWIFTACNRSTPADVHHSDAGDDRQPAALDNAEKSISLFSASPSKVMKLWLKAIRNQDLKTANSLCIIEEGLLNMATMNAICVNGIAQALEKDKEWLERMNGVNPDGESIDGNDAWVTLRHADYQEVWHLVKVDGNWKIKGKK